MPDGGKLIMETFVTDIVKGNSKYHYLKPGKYVTIQISDTGTGMDEATLSHIFEPFFTTKPVDKGTGLGLATVYSIIKAHHGYVIAESLPDKGSAFTIYLPIE
jgi:signal transduction histidine kinase